MLQLLREQRFRQYALAKLFQLAGQNALIYGLFILVIEQQESSFSTSLFVLCAVLPSVLVSIPGGVVADALPRKLVLLTTLALRMAIIVAFIRYDPGLVLVLVFTVLIWTVYQFYSPAEHGALAAVTPPGMNTHANAVMYVVSLLAQFGGAGFVAPLALKTFDEQGLFAVTLMLVAAGAFIFGATANLSPPKSTSQREGPLRSMSGGLRILRSDPLLMRAMLQFVLLGSATTMVVVAIPRYLDDVLSTGVINVVYIFSPGAIGIAFGLAVAPLLTRILGGPTVTLLGFIAFSATLAALAAVDPLSTELQSWRFFSWATDTFHINTSVAATMVIVPFGGLGIALVNVASRALFYERADPGRIGQLFATQSAIGSLASVGPTLAAGVLVDHVDVRYFIAAVAAAMIVSLIPLLAYGRSRTRVPIEALMQNPDPTSPG